jgi:hypothetical protein
LCGSHFLHGIGGGKRKCGRGWRPAMRWRRVSACERRRKADWCWVRFFGGPQNDSGSALRRESLADPLKPYDPVSLCNSPIFPDCFTLRRPHSDAFMHC